MQEEVEYRAVALAITTTKITASILRDALIKLMAEMKKSRGIARLKYPMASRR